MFYAEANVDRIQILSAATYFSEKWL